MTRELPSQQTAPPDWRGRFAEQARWTRALRDYLFDQLHPSGIKRVLEVGCGPGTLTAEIQARTGGRLVGLDLRHDVLVQARTADPSSNWVSGDGIHLPFHTAGFDLVYCHYFLLWVKQPGAALAEMGRVARPGGWILALAEPDYGGRIDFPRELAEIGRLQAKALAEQGADPEMGRKLAGLFREAGLAEVKTGVLGGEWKGEGLPDGWPSEWQVLEDDLKGRLSTGRLRELRQIDADAWRLGRRVLFVPTFYAIGRVPPI